jgi:hypothetical protein
VFLSALGVLVRDGAWIIVAHVCTAIDMALLVVFGATVLHVLARLWHWIA